MREYQGRSLVTCCNIHAEGEDINDANYYVGSLVAAGTPVQVQSVTNDSITFTAEGRKLTLHHQYGTAQESMRQYVDKTLVTDDPRARIASYQPAVQDAIRESRVERGMTRDQVILALGYPATHKTPSTEASEWVYWYNRWVTYRVEFGPDGKVSNVVGRPAPTHDQPIPEATPAAKSVPKKPAPKKKH
jgi:hypothetical protein